MPDGVEEASVCTVSGLKKQRNMPSTNRSCYKENNQKKCSIFHYSAPAETTVESQEPPKGSVGY